MIATKYPPIPVALNDL